MLKIVLVNYTLTSKYILYVYISSGDLVAVNRIEY